MFTIKRQKVRLMVSIFLLVIMSLVSITVGKTIYVDDDGPADFNNIQAAIDDSNEGDTVFVAPGNYKGYVIMKDGVNLQGAGAKDTTLDGGGYTFVVSGANNCRLDGFTITGYAFEDTDGIKCEGIQNFVISRNIIKNNTWDGILVFHGSVVISNNLILNNTCAGVWCYGESLLPSLIVNNTICKNHNEAGINVWYGASADVINNIITRNTGYGGIYCDSGGTVSLVRNNVWGNTCWMIPPADYVGCEPGETDISVDPLFADPNNSDYHLKSQSGHWEAKSASWVKDDVTSPCIDAGDPASPIGLEPFPNGGIINIGAYGGTPEASKSYFGKPPCETIVAGDINGDCIVNFKDFAIMALHWLEER